jgi:hypothetical protein
MPVVKPKSGFTAEEKAEAVERVLSSRTFQKSDLLRQFLKYVCEKEISGSTGRITEYSIATEALGRPADFSPEEDSSVRSRAHALRQKLDDYYRDEAQGSKLRIGLPKGSYVPEFVDQPELLNRLPLPQLPVVETKPRYYLVALAFVAGVAAALLATFPLRSAARQEYVRPSIPDALRQAWGSLLTSGSEVLVVVAIPKQLWARDFSGLSVPRNSNWYPAIDQNPQLLQWFYETARVPSKPFILLHPNVGSPLWGDAAGAMGAINTLSAYGVKSQVLPERILKPYALRDRNVMLFGNPEYSPAVRRLLEGAPFSVEYDPESRWEAVFNRKPKPGEPGVFRRTRTEDCLGLLSVISGEQNEGKASQAVIFSGLTSAGTQAAEEFFASPKAMADLGLRFKSEGIATWPRSYQVVVQATIDTNLPIGHNYRVHRIIAP